MLSIGTQVSVFVDLRIFFVNPDTLLRIGIKTGARS
jgi:hypothetical protein